MSGPPALSSVSAGCVPVVELAGADGSRQVRSLAECAAFDFGDVSVPVRRFPSFRGQRNFPGLWWFSKMSCHVGYESWLERDHVMALDANPDVAGVASQPFRLRWPDGRHHVPDFFAGRTDGSVLVVDVRADEQITDADAELFRRTAVACTSLGWSYRRVGVLDRVVAANLRWLSGYRHPRVLRPGLATELLATFGSGRSLLSGAAAIGPPLVVLPVVFHLMWLGV